MSFYLKSERLAGVVQNLVLDIAMAFATVASLAVIALVTLGVM